MKTEHEKNMQKALRLARKAALQDEVPVGAIIVKDGQVIGRGWNRREQKQNPLEHAEVMAIAQAARKLGTWRLEGCDLYVTLEPCPMCAGAIIQSRIETVYYGAKDEKGGAVDSCTHLFDIPNWNHHPHAVEGILAEESSQMLKDFFRAKRKKNKEKKKMAKIQKGDGTDGISGTVSEI